MCVRVCLLCSLSAKVGVGYVCLAWSAESPLLYCLDQRIKMHLRIYSWSSMWDFYKTVNTH